MLTDKKFDFPRYFAHPRDKLKTKTILEQTKEANNIKCLQQLVLQSMFCKLCFIRSS